MKKYITPDLQIISLYNSYIDFLKANKTMPGLFSVIKEQGNHKSSRFGSVPLNCAVPLGNSSLECEKKGVMDCNYTLRMMSDKIESRLLARFDVGGPAHRNRGEAMSRQPVPTPHLHSYNEKGVLYCYQTEELKRMAAVSPDLPLARGFGFFCSHYNIKAEDGVSMPRVTTAPDGALDMDFNDNDPNANIDF